jgi:3-dehydroquinate synthase
LMSQDKKVRDGRLTFILARGIGTAFVSRDVERPALETFLARELLLTETMGAAVQP